MLMIVDTFLARSSFDEAMLALESQTHVSQAREEADIHGTAYNPCCGRLRTSPLRSHCAARIVLAAVVDRELEAR